MRRGDKPIRAPRPEQMREGSSHAFVIRDGSSLHAASRSLKMNRVDYRGRTFGRAKVVAMASNRGKRTHWKCRCFCGGEFEASTDNLRSGTTLSCGCLRIEVTARRSIIHGETADNRRQKRSPEYRAWCGMKDRCFNENTERFRHYGERGITICPEWLSSFSDFLDYVGRRPRECNSIGRIDVNKGYEPGNVRWENASQQARSRTDNIWVIWNDERMVLKDAVTIAGVSYKAVHADFRYKGIDPVVAIRNRQIQLGATR